MLIGDIARQSDVTPSTIRYYEEIGLLTAPPRSEAGYRRYSGATLEELEFIKKGSLQAFRDRLAGQIVKWKGKAMLNCKCSRPVRNHHVSRTAL
jgi:DNA-binding transcriptional MerR regulator